MKYKGQELPSNVSIVKELSDEELRRLQNESQFHLQPSATEGWSHVLHEALSVNASILTTDAPPMNEIKATHRIPSCGNSTLHAAKLYEVSALDIYNAVQGLRPIATDKPRAEFLAENEAFGKRFAAVLDNVITKPAAPVVVTPTPKQPGSLRIAFLGNFSSPESTENMVKWALERLGHQVIPLQENKVMAYDILEPECDVFLWVRTPGWLQASEDQMERVLAQFRKERIPTVSLHLDKFWQIPEREPEIGKHPFWKTAHCFTADGGFQKEFRERGVNHHWMEPAMSEVYLHPGVPREEYLCDVGFVGAREYHAEYAFRPVMVDFLKKTYGSRFKHITNLRGHGLNDFYASCKVAVADCIFAGTPNYWSDRAPETIGRGGFLLHPRVEGFDIPTALYEPQDLHSLNHEIEYSLKNVKNRLAIARGCTQHVARYDTWTVRMQQILETVTQ